MATPTFARFSRFTFQHWTNPARGLFDVLACVDEAMRSPWDAELKEVARLLPSHDASDGGLALENGILPCRSLAEARSVVRGSPAFGLVYDSREASGELYLYVFDVRDDGFSLSLAAEPSLVSFGGEAFHRGEWLQGVLATITSALGLDVCGFGRDNDYMVKHEPLDAARVLERLRSGELLRLPLPIFHVIAERLIGADEVLAIMSPLGAELHRSYHTIPGYHLIGRIEM